LIRSDRILRRLDQWIRRKIRVLKIKQLKRRYTLWKFYRSCGLLGWQAWIGVLTGKGWWRQAAMPQAHRAMNLKWFEEQGLVSLSIRWQEHKVAAGNRLGAYQACRMV